LPCANDLRTFSSARRRQSLRRADHGHYNLKIKIFINS
jgi:hypothetical protein